MSNRSRRDFTTPAIITMVLYCFFWLPGFIANCAYLSSAHTERQQTGVSANGVGCLYSLLVVFVALPVVVLVAIMAASR